MMEEEFVAVERHMPILRVAELTMQRDNAHLYDFIVVTHQGRYIGTVTIRDLLLQAMEIHTNQAMSANPLTGLPGNRMIDERLEKCLNTGGCHYTAFGTDYQAERESRRVHRPHRWR